LLASLKERSTYGEFDCFLGTVDENGLKGGDLVDEATSDVFVLFWEAVVLPTVEAFSYF